MYEWSFSLVNNQTILPKLPIFISVLTKGCTELRAALSRLLGRSIFSKFYHRDSELILKCNISSKVRKEEDGIDTIKYNTLPRAPYEKAAKTQENITHKGAKRQALSQHAITRLQGTDKTAWQTRNTNNKNDPQKKHPHPGKLQVL